MHTPRLSASSEELSRLPDHTHAHTPRLSQIMLTNTERFSDELLHGSGPTLNVQIAALEDQDIANIELVSLAGGNRRSRGVLTKRHLQQNVAYVFEFCMVAVDRELKPLGELPDREKLRSGRC